jgi:tetratricopeptide (TPR) repeat protein
MKRISGILLFLIVFLPLLAQNNNNNSNNQLAWEYYNQREYEKAAPLFLRMYEENKLSNYLHYYVNCLLETRNYEEAVTVVKKALRQTKDITLNVQLGYIYEISGDNSRAEEAYLEPMKSFPANAPGIINLGNTYSSYAKYTYSQMVFETGRKVLGNPNEFRIELANVFYSQRRFADMLEEYFNLLLTDPKYVSTVQVMIQNALANDIDETLLQMTSDKTYSFIQKWPGLPVFSEMLVWVLSEQKRFPEAADEAIAMDRRNQAPPEKVLQVARLSADAGSPDAAIKAYQYLINRGPAGQNRQPVYNLARVEFLMTLSSKMAGSGENPATEWTSLAGEFRQGLTDLGKEGVSDPLHTGLADIEAFRLNDYPRALSTIEAALALPGKSPLFRTECLLKKGDILLASGDPWEASMVYSMVDMENPDNPQGSAARFRKAQLSWFTGNYKWALAQLEILKGSTSKPNANDAMELSILIRENLSETDSTQTNLMKLAHIDYLIFMRHTDDALAALDSIIDGPPGEPATDDCLYKKALIQFERNNQEAGIVILERIIENFRYEYWGHKALYELARLCQDQLNDSARALVLFEEFIRDFPGSFYFLDARNRIKALKSKT